MTTSREQVRRVLEAVNARIREMGWANVYQEERDVADVDAFYGCVLNGGFDSLFFNSAYLGDMAVELSAALTRVGAIRAAMLAQEAFSRFPGGVVPAPLDSRVMWLRAQDAAEPFADIDHRFYKEAEKEDAVLLEFFSKHPARFECQAR
jgi:hypothetical protein